MKPWYSIRDVTERAAAKAADERRRAALFPIRKSYRGSSGLKVEPDAIVARFGAAEVRYPYTKETRVAVLLIAGAGLPVELAERCTFIVGKNITMTGPNGTVAEFTKTDTSARMAMMYATFAEKENAIARERESPTSIDRRFPPIPLNCKVERLNDCFAVRGAHGVAFIPRNKLDRNGIRAAAILMRNQ